MQIPIDEATFTRYACELLPEGTDYVTYKEFLAFHKAVWANQPASVRRFAGDPSAKGESPFQGSASVKRLMRSASVPSGASLRELRDNEDMLRSAFRRYERPPGYLDRRELPSFFADIGLDLGVASELGLQGSTRLNTFLTSQVGQDRVSLHDLVEIQNKYIAKLEVEKFNRKPESIMNLKADGASFKLSKEVPVTAQSLVALKREAQLQRKVEMCGQFRDLVKAAEVEVPPDSPGASRAKLLQITR
jgi:hypothetical protein